MSSSPERVARFAKGLRVVVWLLILAIPAGLLIPPLAGMITPERAGAAFVGLTLPDAFAGWQVAALTLIGALPAAAMVYALLALRRLLTFYSNGDRLSPGCAQAIRHIGLGLLGTAAANLITHPFQVLTLTAMNPVGSRSLAIAVGWEDAAFLLAGGVVVLIGWVMGEAAHIAEDHKAIV